MQLLPPNNLKSGLKETPLDELMPYRPGWFGHRREYKVEYYYPMITWTHCRDIFQDAKDNEVHMRGMWFCHIKNQGHNICTFINLLEEKISRKRRITQRTVFMETKYHNILWLQPAPFWINDFVRRSFFTLCLRSGQWYRRSKDNFNQAMFHYGIAQESKAAVMRFLDGYTFYTGECPESNTMGWGYLFFEEDGDHLKSLLTTE